LIILKDSSGTSQAVLDRSVDIANEIVNRFNADLEKLGVPNTDKKWVDERTAQSLAIRSLFAHVVVDLLEEMPPQTVAEA